MKSVNMNREKLEIEVQACLITANELAKGDRYMDTTIKKMVDELRAKAADIKKLLECDHG